MPVSVTEKNLGSRSRAIQTEFRKRQLIEATIDCIDKFGLSQTTIARIAKRAGVSQGIVVFHFRSKKALLERALQELSREHMESWKSALDTTHSDPVSRLCALVKSNFTATICNRKKISVWHAFWGESRSRPRYMELCGNNDLEFSTTLLSLCVDIEAVSPSTLSAQTAALSIESMIDGLWQNFLIGPPGFNRQQAMATVFELMEVIYPGQRQNIRQFSIS
jgi:TetR/AcrR family transcriptional repressor of bet genes